MKIGIIGCGNISSTYFNGALNARNCQVVACADMRMEAAEAQAQAFGVRAMSVDALLADPEIGLVINLTIPAAHSAVSARALEAGKHVYSEKPLAIDDTAGQDLLTLAESRGLRVGCAPDTFLGGGPQTARKLLEEGAIGRPVAGLAFMGSRGPDAWHPNPAFFFERGAGPMMDMGPYYITAMINLLGPVEAVTAFTTRGRDVRTADNEAIRGRELPVSVDTHQAGTLRFVGGQVVTLVTSFDVPLTEVPRIEVYGTIATLSHPDPNYTSGPVRIALRSERQWQEMPLTHAENARMIGVVDMVQAIRDGRPHRASGALAQHVLEVMLAFERSSQSGHAITIKTRVPQPQALPAGLDPWTVD